MNKYRQNLISNKIFATLRFLYVIGLDKRERKNGWCRITWKNNSIFFLFSRQRQKPVKDNNDCVSEIYGVENIGIRSHMKASGRLFCLANARNKTLLKETH
jgi:hypothetical protein